MTDPDKKILIDALTAIAMSDEKKSAKLAKDTLDAIAPEMTHVLPEWGELNQDQRDGWLAMAAKFGAPQFSIVRESLKTAKHKKDKP